MSKVLVLKINYFIDNLIDTFYIFSKLIGWFLVFAVLSVEAQIPSFGKCPIVISVANLNATRLTGIWYQVERYFTVSEIGSSCATCTFGTNEPGSNGTSTIPAMFNLRETFETYCLIIISIY